VTVALRLWPALATCRGCKTLGDYVGRALILGVFTVLLYFVLTWWTGRRRHRSRRGRASTSAATRHHQKSISASRAAQGFTLVVDALEAGGYSARSTDDADLKLEAPTLVEVDDQVRQTIRDHLADNGHIETSLAYVWQDSGAIAPAAAGGHASDKSDRPPKNLHFEVHDATEDGYLAESESGVRITANTLDGLLPAARTEIARRWPGTIGSATSAVTFSWVRNVRI
jgi:hypothetical protein